MASFRIIGPIYLPTKDGPLGRELTRNCRQSVIEQIDDSITNSKGCYVFGMEYRLIKPWYVGKTKKQSVITESLNNRNRELYNRVIQQKSGSPLLFFVVPKKRPGQINHREIGQLEQTLISFAWEQNPHILNTNLKDEWTWDIPGVWGTKVGRPTKATSYLKEMLGL